jgi:hypothetical protein
MPVLIVHDASEAELAELASALKRAGAEADYVAGTEALLGGLRGAEQLGFWALFSARYVFVVPSSKYDGLLAKSATHYHVHVVHAAGEPHERFVRRCLNMVT